MAFFNKPKKTPVIKYPGIRMAADGHSALMMCENESCDASSAVDIPSIDKDNHRSQRSHVEAENEIDAASIAAGMSLSGLRVSQFSYLSNLTSLHPSLYASVGKRLPYLLNVSCHATTKSAPNLHGGHDDYYAISDTGVIQLFAKNNQAVADLSIIAHKIAELSLNPIALAQDSVFTAQMIEPLNLPEPELIQVFLGQSDDQIASPTPAQRILYGENRRRIPEVWTVDQPSMSGSRQTADMYMSSVAAQRPYFFDHVERFTDQCMQEWFELTGREYRRINTYCCDDADYLIIGHGSLIQTAETVADYLRDTQQIKVGVVNMTLLRPFPGDLISKICQGRKGITVMEKTDQPLAVDLPLMTDIRTAMSKSVENGHEKSTPFPHYATYTQVADNSLLYSACFGLGGHILQLEEVVAVINNMHTDGQRKKFVYLGIDFVRTTHLNPHQEIQQQAVTDAYPQVRELTLPTVNPLGLRFDGIVSLRIHTLSIGDKHHLGPRLAFSLFDLLGHPFKANQGGDMTQVGHPITYHLALDSEAVPILNPTEVKAVIALDPNVFSQTNPLSGLNEAGILLIQSALNTPEEVWLNLPKSAQEYIKDQNIQMFFLDGFKIVREESVNSDLHFQQQSLAFQSAWFKVTDILQQIDRSIDDILSLIATPYDGHVTENLKIAQRGFAEIQAIDSAIMKIGQQTQSLVDTPFISTQHPVNDEPLVNIHRFLAQMEKGKAQTLADPFLATNIVPAATGLYRDMSSMRFEHPQWVPENCTACGNCYAMCPDSAIPGLINSVNEVFETTIKRIEKTGKIVKHLRRAIRLMEKKYHLLTVDKTEGTTLAPVFARAIGETIKEYPEIDRKEVSVEFNWFKVAMGDFKFALTKPYHNAMNKRTPNSGGLYSITINPMSCKGCMECVDVCDDEALKPVPQTPASLETLRYDWVYWNDLPTSNLKYQRIDDLNEKIGALDTLLLDKKNYQSMTGGDNACPGSGEKTAVHLFTSTVMALMQPRVKQHLTEIDQLIVTMDRHIRLILAENLTITNIETLETAIENNQDVDLTLSRLSASLDENKPTHPLDRQWLRRVALIVTQLKQLKARYLAKNTHPRAEMGMVNSADHTTWGEYPISPYPFPWTSHLFNDAPVLAMGIFAGHMLKMTTGFETIRRAKLEIAGQYDPESTEAFFNAFDWHQFSEEEYRLCPPIVVMGGNKSLNEKNLSDLLISGVPIKVLILDSPALVTCKTISLFAMSHQQTYVLQSSIAQTNHLLEGYIDGLNYQGAAVFSVYAVNQIEQGVATDAAEQHSKLAVEARAYPLMSFDPRLGDDWSDNLSLQGNPCLDQDWVRYTLNYKDEYGIEESIKLPLTFADWAFTERRFHAYFNVLSASQWNDEMLEVAEFINLSTEERNIHTAFVYAVHPKTHQLIRVQVANEIIQATCDRRDSWRTLKGIAGLNQKIIDPLIIAHQAKADVAQSLAINLMKLAGGDGQELIDFITSTSTVMSSTPTQTPTIQPKSPAGGQDAVWIETPDCTTCDECVEIAPAMFQYNEDKKAVVINPTAGTYEQIVKAAEKCTAVIIHPGMPWNADEKNLEKLIKRAEKFQ